MFKHSDVLISIFKPSGASITSNSSSVTTINKSQENNNGKSSEYMILIPVEDLIKINSKISNIAKNIDGAGLVAGFADVDSRKYRFIVHNGFIIDSRIIDDTIYYKAYLNRVKESVTKRTVSSKDMDIYLYYAYPAKLSSVSEDKFMEELADCFNSCGC